jgi:FkbM family methyltransferase
MTIERSEPDWNDAAKRNQEDFKRFKLISKTILKPGMKYVDIGACRGDYVEYISKVIRIEDIFAFEPNPNMAEHLHQIYPKAHIKEIAIGNFDGVTDFFISNFEELSGLAKRDLSTLPKGTNFKRIQVVCKKLDTVLSEKVDFVKIDVERNEIGVLQGMQNILTKSRPYIFIEHGPNGPEYFGNSSIELWDILQKFQYEIMTIDGDDIKTMDMLVESFWKWNIWNYLLIPRNL